VALKPVLSGRAQYEANSRRSVILLIGINYDQYNKEDYPLFTRYLGSSIVENPEAPSSKDYVRIGIETSLIAFQRNEGNWKSAAFWRGGRLPVIASSDAVPLRDYIIVVTNFYPLITRHTWSAKKTERERNFITSLWRPAWHLEPLMEKLEGRVDLFIGHGKGEVWEKFDEWRDRLACPWLKIYNCGSYFNPTVTARQNENHPWFSKSS
jgi:hypothetical protein